MADVQTCRLRILFCLMENMIRL